MVMPWELPFSGWPVISLVHLTSSEVLPLRQAVWLMLYGSYVMSRSAGRMGIFWAAWNHTLISLLCTGLSVWGNFNPSKKMKIHVDFWWQTHAIHLVSFEDTSRKGGGQMIPSNDIQCHLHSQWCHLRCHLPSVIKLMIEKVSFYQNHGFLKWGSCAIHRCSFDNL